MTQPLNLSTLGLHNMQPMKNLSLVPVPTRPAKRVSISLYRGRPSEHQDASIRTRVASLSGQMTIGLVELDYAARALQELGKMKGELKFRLNTLQNQAETLMVDMQKEFSMMDSEVANIQSDLAGQAIQLMLQLQPHQVEAWLKHAHEMSKSNLAYIPKLTPPQEEQAA
jgi:hypothetical protein